MTLWKSNDRIISARVDVYTPDKVCLLTYHIVAYNRVLLSARKSINVEAHFIYRWQICQPRLVSHSPDLKTLALVNVIKLTNFDWPWNL